MQRWRLRVACAALLLIQCVRWSAAQQIQLCPNQPLVETCNATYTVSSGNNFFFFQDGSECGREITVEMESLGGFILYVSTNPSVQFPTSVSVSYEDVTSYPCSPSTCGGGLCCKVSVPADKQQVLDTYYINIDANVVIGAPTATIDLEMADCEELNAAAVAVLILLLVICCGLPCCGVAACFFLGVCCFSKHKKTQPVRNHALQVNNNGVVQPGMSAYPQGTVTYPQGQPAGYPHAGYPQGQPAYPQAQQAGYPQAQTAGYPQAQPAGYPQAQPAGYPQAQPVYAQQPPVAGYDQTPPVHGAGAGAVGAGGAAPVAVAYNPQPQNPAYPPAGTPGAADGYPSATPTYYGGM